MDTLFSTPPLNVQPYFMHFVFAAEDHAGVFDRYAWTQMQRWHLNLETHTFNENWYGGRLEPRMGRDSTHPDVRADSRRNSRGARLQADRHSATHQRTSIRQRSCAHRNGRCLCRLEEL